MTPEARAQVLTERLPLAWQEGPAIQTLMGALAQELDHGERGIQRLLHSRHLWGARPWDRDTEPEHIADSDLGRLGALLGLRPRPNERDRSFRQRIASLMAVHRSGLGTADAILHLCVLALGCESAPQIQTLMEGGERFTRGVLPVRDAAGRKGELHLDVLDNPGHHAQAQGALSETQTLTLNNQGVLGAFAELDLRAETPLSFPLLLNRDQGLALLYAGHLAAGERLHLGPWGCWRDGGAPAPLLALRTQTLDAEGLLWGALSWASGLELSQVLTLPPGPNVWVLRSISPGAAGALLREAGLPVPAECVEPDPALLEAAWFQALPEDSRLDSPDCVLASDDDESQGALLVKPFDDADDAPLQALPCSATLSARWFEREPATFALRFSGELLPSATPDLASLLSALQDCIRYGRAAGVRGRVQQVQALPVDEAPVPEDALRGLGMIWRERLEPEDHFLARVSIVVQDSLYLPELRPNAGTAKMNRSELDEAVFAQAKDAKFGEAKFQKEAFAEADPAVFDEGLFQRETFAWAESHSLPPLTGDEPPLAALDEAVLDSAAFAAAPPALFTEEGLTLNQAALGRGMPAGVLDAVFFGDAAFMEWGEADPPEKLLRAASVPMQVSLTEDCAAEIEPEPS